MADLSSFHNLIGAENKKGCSWFRYNSIRYFSFL